VAAVLSDIQRIERRIPVWVNQYADAGRTELDALRGEVKRAEERLTSLATERANLERQITQAAVTPAQLQNSIALAAQLREYIPTADYDAKRYVLDRLGIGCRLRRTQDGQTWADVTANLQGAVETTALQISLPATPGRCCDSRPAPRTPGGRSG